MEGLLKLMESQNGLQSIIGLAVLASLLWGGSQLMKVPDQLDQLSSDMKLLAYRVEQLEKQ